ncbi:restriction endonuclease subunit S [Pseudomonas sp. PDM09]|uniref:restriction endonuclease subunit S n=1 Tax=Pseudomonas sp. PDM09 TaxID=2769270 RepID=UPI001783A111|nr:restriction endonuclease subunit S [Pseudomonas sp. PDM09]
MTALLTDNLPLLAGAPNGIKKLRELILELAVRGKLVPQDPSDEPASELLKRIAEEKALSGNLKKTKSLAEITEDEKPFAAPISWVLSRLGHVGEWAVGSGFPTQEQGLTDQPIPFCKVSDMNLSGNERFILTANNSIDEITASRLRVNVHPAGTVVFPKIGGAIATNKRRLLVKPTAIDNNCLGLTPNGTLSSDYLYLLLSSIDLTRYQAGTSVPALSQGVLADIIVGVPPLAEQHRIVAKVDELMALSDRLEAQQADAESAHAQLVQALLDSLTQASGVTDFAANWQRLAEHFHTLFTTEPSIDALKQTLLQMAVMGKLVPQDASDEPASQLLKRIAEEKARLVAEGKLKKHKPLDEIVDEERPFLLPRAWAWVKPEEFSMKITDGEHFKPDTQKTGVYFLSAKDIRDDGVSLENPLFISEETAKKALQRCDPQYGDLLIVSRGATVGRMCKVNVRERFCLLGSVILIKPSEHVLSDFLSIALKSPDSFRQLVNASGSTAQPAIYLRDLKKIALPLPPLAEQHRIVAKVDQLMALCDQLKTRLTQARLLNEQLASTLVERSLAEDAQQIPIVTDRQVARTLLAAEVTHRLHSQRTFGQRKLQKVIYLAEHAAKLAAIQGYYLRDAAGPHDRQLMNKVEGEMQTHQWYERIERETVGHAYRPLSQAGQHRQAYSNAWSVAEQATIEQVIELMRDWDTDRCEMTVTLYAAWNDFILEGRPISDDAIVGEVMHSWNDTKLRFGKTEWLAVLAEMKKHKILMPTGFGKRTKGGMLSLPGFE